MLKCPKCLGNMKPILAKIQLKVGDTMLETISEAGRCNKCDNNIVNIQVKVIPLENNVISEKIQERLNA